jgi:PAS domain S-box-containing protein
MSAYQPEWLCKEIVDGAHDAVILADRDGVIRLWNAGAEAMFGYRADEAVGRTLDLIIPERLRARHWEGWHAAMARGSTEYGDRTLAVPGERRDGSRVSLEFTIGLIRDSAGEIAAVSAILRDVTERFERDRERQRRLAAAEGGGSRPLSGRSPAGG